MSRYLEYGTVYLIGACGYTLIEILWRGYSHWTMTLTGGLCFLVIYLSEIVFFGAPLWKRCVVGSLCISFAELTVGFVVNILLGWGVWDYSDMMFNVCGQVCLLYSGLWFLLCMPVAYLCRLLRRRLRAEKRCGNA